MASDDGMTAEDRVIYDPEVSAMIDRALVDLVDKRGSVQAILERLVWAVVRWERGE